MLFNYELDQKENRNNPFNAIIKWCSYNKMAITITAISLIVVSMGYIVVGIIVGAASYFALYFYNIYQEVSKLDFTRNLEGLAFYK